MKNKTYTFKKKRTNADTFEHVMIIIFLIIITAFSFNMLINIELIKDLSSIPQLIMKSLRFSIITLTISIVITLAYFSLTIPFGYLKYIYRLNKLNEQLRRNQTISKKIIFPKVEIFYDIEKETFYFKFLWEAVWTTDIQKTIDPLLSQIMFPKNDYFFEEPIITQANTTFVYKKNPKRLVINYEK
ncbi:hypothetical protein DOK78_000319 [Enterococcus sp. DIV2402]|uniref:Uncharacterized protein n=1 Tax=Candidatus Enterococcus lowellii TaxID=2230877 RepID=A0ABZ2SIQ0_9ENTE|nr:hypothetical protein [Enterococcus sp. DIV2402]MBO0464806.1 hypothetical protein [Enterococcus sp. DIV2402]